MKNVLPRSIRAPLLLALGLTPGICHGAGGMTSGGGDLVSDEQNPWWVSNTKSVSYCLDLDAANFGAAADLARVQIRKALDYWRTEFASVDNQNDELPGHLATQEFAEEPCQATTDLRFQLGKLTDEQRPAISHPERVIGQAVRTSYDSQQLHGKGFVYVSPEFGPLSLTGSGKVGGSILPKRWQAADGKILQLVLIHELGHVFGLPHMFPGSVMDAIVPDLYVTYPVAYAVTKDTPITHTFPRTDKLLVTTYDTYAHFEGHADVLRKYFGATEDYAYAELRPVGHDGFALYAGAGRTAPLKLLGTGKRAQAAGLAMVTSSYVYTYVTPQQQAFQLEHLVPVNGRSLTSYVPTEVSFPVIYTEAGSTRDTQLKLESLPGGIRLAGSDDRGAIQSLFFAGERSPDWNLVPKTDPVTGLPPLPLAVVNGRSIP